MTTITRNGDNTHIGAGGIPNAVVIGPTGITSGVAPGVITAAMQANDAKPLGVGQTWQNLTASRAYGVTYTNTTGRPIAVIVNSNTAQAQGVSVAGELITPGGPMNTPTTFIVPAGAAYLVTGASLIRWAELR